jgi:copper ion binding protein
MKTRFNVKGMHCRSCEMLIQESVSEIDGVESIEADHRKGYVEVKYDEKKATEKMIKDAIKKEGYVIE